MSPTERIEAARVHASHLADGSPTFRLDSVTAKVCPCAVCAGSGTGSTQTKTSRVDRFDEAIPLRLDHVVR